MKNELITIVFSPPSTIKDELINLNKELSKEYKTNFVSEFPTFTPHITIYQAEFPKKNEKKVLHTIESLATVSGEVSFVPTGIEIKGRYVSLGFKGGGEAERFHKKLIEKLNPLREGSIKDAYKNSMRNFTQTEKENIDKWGYPYVMDIYKPHLTVLALADEKDATVASRGISWSKTFLVNTVIAVVSRVDEHAKKLKTFHEFNLGAKKLVIFDFDGPILDSLEVSYERTKRNWPEITHEQHRNLFSGNIFKELEKLGPKNESPEAEKEWLTNVYFPNKLNLGPVEGIKGVLEELKDYTLTINTSSSEKEVKGYLEKHQLSPFFSDVLGAETSKNKVEKFNILLKKYNIVKSDAILVTDTVGDVLDAEEAGITSVLVSWGYQTREHFAKINDKIIAIVDTPAELAIVIKTFLKK